MMRKSWRVEGIEASFQKGMPRMVKKSLVVRYTSDQIGKSLSISDDNAGFMFEIPMDFIIKDLIGGEKK